MAHTGHSLHEKYKPQGDSGLHPPCRHVLPSQGQRLEVPGQAGKDHPARRSPYVAAGDHSDHSMPLPTSESPGCKKTHVQAMLSLVAMAFQPKTTAARSLPLPMPAAERISSRMPARTGSERADSCPQQQPSVQCHTPVLRVNVGGCHFGKLLPTVCSLMQQREKLRGSACEKKGAQKTEDERC